MRSGVRRGTAGTVVEYVGNQDEMTETGSATVSKTNSEDLPMIKLTATRRLLGAVLLLYLLTLRVQVGG